MKRFCITILTFFTMFLCFSIASAQEKNLILKIKGDVFILKKGSFRKNFAKENQEIFSGDIVITGESSTVMIQTKDKSRIVVDESSRLKMEEENLFKQEEGKVYYNIEKKEQKGFKVKTEFAVIGVKGTEFIIDSGKDTKAVALKNGLIGVESLKNDFELKRKKELSAYKSFSQKTKSDFSEYKKKNREEFVEYVKSFDLQPGKIVVFSGNKVNEDEFSDKIDMEFEKFRAMI